MAKIVGKDRGAEARWERYSTIVPAAIIRLSRSERRYRD
jgi:hypothetical protein